MACAICEIRRPKRACPGVHGDICAICCGNEREVTVTCPLDCEYLRESRKRERRVEFDPAQLPNRDIKITESFLEQNQELLTFVGQAILRAALATPGLIDQDCREALDALVRTYRTLQSGVYYDSLPQAPTAVGLYQLLRQGIDEFREKERETLGTARTRDADVLGVMVFYQQLEMMQNNGRPRGRAFLSGLVDFYGLADEVPSSPSLILP
jgi:hypothetical protein